jgi:diguanylate cyclase (GGDEF)-like protein
MTVINKILSKVSALFYMVLKVTRKKADHKKLTRHIVALNQKKSSIEIIKQSACCLKEIINYQLFAFAIKKGNQVDVWFDPKICKKLLEEIIFTDFNLLDKSHLNYLNPHDVTLKPDDQADTFNLKGLVSYGSSQEDHYSKIYILPDNIMYTHHDTIAKLVLQSCSFALLKQMKIENLSNAAVMDPLTGCYNRREFENQLKKNIARAIRHKNDLSIFMFDLDHFKKINDTFGHLAGDEVLRKITLLVQENMRKGDIFARYGGEEFIAILPETGKMKAMELAERLRIKISNKMIEYDKNKIKVTASFGVSRLNHNCTDMNSLIKNVDNMLYKAKLKGRNLVMPCLMKVVPDLPGEKYAMMC